MYSENGNLSQAKIISKQRKVLKKLQAVYHYEDRIIFDKNKEFKIT